MGQHDDGVVTASSRWMIRLRSSPRLLQLHRAQIRWRDFLQGLYVILKRGNVAEAVSLCEEASGPVPMVIRAAILHHDEGAEKMRRAMHEVGLQEIPRIERNLSLLATFAHIAPMLGLLGIQLLLSAIEIDLRSVPQKPLSDSLA